MLKSGSHTCTVTLELFTTSDEIVVGTELVGREPIVPLMNLPVPQEAGPQCQETRTPVAFFPHLLTMDAPPFLPLTTFPLYVWPNRLHSPPSLVFIVASSST